MIIEENHIGGNFHEFPACFAQNNKHVFLISGKYAIGYDVYTGKRVFILKHDVKVVGIIWRREKLYIFTIKCELHTYTYTNGDYTLEKQRKIHPEIQELSFVYTVGEKILLVLLLSGKIFTSADHKEHRVYSFYNLDTLELQVETILPDIIQERRIFDLGEECAVYATHKKIHLFPYKNSKISTKKKMVYEFKHKPFDRVLDQNMLKFDGVKIVGNALFASLNIGRVYIWQNIKDGFSTRKNHPIYVHVHSSSITFAISNHLTMFCGSGDCKLTKWHTKTSGAGRWQYPQKLDGLNVPDETLILATLDDNSVVVAQTATMTIVSRPEVMLWATDKKQHWLGLCSDPARKDFLVTSGRLGMIQWIDPVRWLTVGMLDVTEENLKVRDNLLYNEKEIWSNVYLVLLTQNSVVTCERRRDDLHLEQNKTLIKFFNRLIPGSVKDFKLEDIMVSEEKILFLQSSHDEILRDEMSDTDSEKFLKIDALGLISVLVRDEKRSGRRRSDMHRTLQWQDSLVISCSKIREETFATANLLQGYSYVLIWDLVTLSVLDYIDCLNNVKQVYWAPKTQPQLEESLQNSEISSHILLILTQDCVAAYDLHLRGIQWIIKQPNLKLYANLFLCCAYNDNTITTFDCLTGKTSQRCMFSWNNDKFSQVIATGDENSLRLSVLTTKNKLVLLKEESLENSIQTQNGDENEQHIKKTTPFSNLIEQAREKAREKERIQTVHTPSIKKLLDGPAYTLAPITQLAPMFVRSCLIKK